MPIQLQRYTPEEYLELEAKADYKSEYRAGENLYAGVDFNSLEEA